VSGDLSTHRSHPVILGQSEARERCDSPGPRLGCGSYGFIENSESIVVGEELAKNVAVTTFVMNWIDITYLYFNELLTISA